MQMLIITLVMFGLGGLLGMGVFMIGIALEARHVPSLPLRMRLNPFNILADRDLWTPKIHSLHRAALRCGLVFLGAAILAFLVGVLSTMTAK
jgi:hypothetical protein